MKSNRIKFLLLVAVLVFCSYDAFGQFAWTKDARNPVMSGVVGTWNKHILSPCVLFNSDSARYEMWFNSTPGPQGYPNSHPWSIGFAVSKDGINWSIYPSAVLKADSGKWDNASVAMPEVIRENRQYKMWYSSWKDFSSPNYLGYATSSDGIHWTKYAGNPIFGPGSSAWEAGGPFSCSVMAIQGGYKMWYGGYDASFARVNTGYASSTDGISWKRDTVNNPVLSLGAGTQWDDKIVSSPNVLRIGNTYYMWYVGIDASGRYDATGVATSLDGITNWKKYASNPVLVASSGGWDGQWAEVGAVLQRGDTLHMWYEGYVAPETLNRISIGHATSLLIASGIAERNQEVPANFSLSQNYPNPFNPSTTIGYDIAKAAHVTIRIHDVLGRTVGQLVNTVQSPSRHTVQWNPAGLSSGIYLYRIDARYEDGSGTFSAVRKLIYMK